MDKIINLVIYSIFSISILIYNKIKAIMDYKQKSCLSIMNIIIKS